MNYLGAFFAGALLFNSIPHLVQGICGKRHMTPFARSSSAVVNVIWAWINLLAGSWILHGAKPASWNGPLWGAFCLGGFLTSVYLALFWTNPDARLPWHKG